MILSALTNNGSGIEAGEIYRRFGAGSLIETAQVLEVARDRMGIPHVRFQLQVTRGTEKPLIEYRTLALESFHAKFRDRVRA